MPTYGTDVTSSSYAIGSGSVNAANAFDNSSSTQWYNDTGANGAYVGQDFGANNKQNIVRLKIYRGYSVSVDWTFYGSDDSGQGTLLTSFTTDTNANAKWLTVDFTNTVTYRYYRCYGTTEHSDKTYIQCNEMEMIPDTSFVPPSSQKNQCMVGGM